MTRLAIFCPKIGERSETFIQRHINELSPDNVVVVTFRILPEAERAWNVSCPVLKVLDLSFEGFRSGRHIQRYLPPAIARSYYSARISRFLRKHAVDTMMGQYLHQSWPFLPVANRLGIRFYGHAHGYDLSKHWRNALWRNRYQDYRNSAGVIVVNRVMRERLISIGIPEGLIHIVPCGVEIPEAMPQRAAHDGCRFLAVGRLVEKKGPLKTLQAFKLASQAIPAATLDIIGTGPMMGAVQEFVDSNSLNSKVKIHGGQAHSFVIEKMMNSDCFLQHSVVAPITYDEEGMPVAILEAMAMGLPVVSTLHAGIPDAVEQGQSGFLVEENDVNGMAAAMVNLATDAGLRKRMGESAWHTASSKFTFRTEKEKLTKILRLQAA